MKSYLSELYSGSSETSEIGFFYENSVQLKAVNYFWKKFPS